MNFRKFRNEDAGFCFETRSSAFIKEFNKELTSAVIKACLSAYSVSDFIAISNNAELFIAENHWGRVGFFVIERLDENTAEVPLIYFSLNVVRQGYGREAIAFIEDWISINWPEVKEIIVQTIIPKYNSGFYQKMGYTEADHSIMHFGEKGVRVVRFGKGVG